MSSIQGINSVGGFASTLAFTNEIINQNIATLNGRTKGKFTFDDDGSIRKMSFCERIAYRFSSRKHREFKADFANFIKHITINEYTPDENKTAISELFLTRLAHKSRKLYTRDIDKTVYDFLAEKIQEESPEPNLNENALEGKVWARIGNYEKSEQGCSISYRVYKGDSQETRILGIFKASIEDTLAKGNKKIGQRIKRKVIPRLPNSVKGSLMDVHTGQGYVAEVVQKRIADRVLQYVATFNPDEREITDNEAKVIAMLKKGLVADTSIVNYKIGNTDAKVGSFQEWIEGRHQEAGEYLGVSKKYGGRGNSEHLETFPQEFLDVLAIVDFVTNQCDRHSENWFVMLNDDDEIDGIRLIDGGWAMSPAHAESTMAIEIGSQYAWAKLEIANQNFTRLGQHIIQQFQANKDDITKEISDLYAAAWEGDQAPPDSPQDGQERANLMKIRIEALSQLLINHGNTMTKKELARYQTAAQISDVVV